MREPEWWEYELRHQAARERFVAFLAVVAFLLGTLVAGAGLGALLGIPMR